MTIADSEGLALSRKPRLAVFGGTFDPLHNGHIYMAGEILRHRIADEVLFVPAERPPHKDAGALTPSAHRLAMLQLALEPYPEFSVSDIEIQKTSRPSYTIETLEMLHAAYPGHQLAFLLGADSLADLHLWHRASELVSRYEMLVFPRPGEELPVFAVLAEKFGAKLARKLQNSLLDIPGFDVSATHIRQAVAAKLCLAGLVPDTIRNYIKQHELYQNPQEKERTEWLNQLPNQNP